MKDETETEIRNLIERWAQAVRSHIQAFPAVSATVGAEVRRNSGAD